VRIAITRRQWLGAVGSLAGAAAIARYGAAAETAAAPAAKAGIRDIPPYALYAFDNGLNGPDVPTVEAKAALLKKLGYAGMTDHFNLKRLPQVLEALDKQGLEFASLYCTPQVEAEIDPLLKDYIALLKGRRARIEIGFTSKQFKPSDPAADDRAAQTLKRVADWCGDTGPVISIYPHVGFWTHRAEDGVRLAKKVGLKTVGTNLNLYHWQAAKPVRPLEELLPEVLPHCMLVTINGMDKGKIVSLAEGDFDVAGFMAAVKRSGYAGPVGLQCYSIAGPSEPHLARSMTKWLEIKKSLAM
jgi:sugar phosphate isomerase/epimerase